MKNSHFLQTFCWWGPLLFLIAIAPFTADWDRTLSQHAFSGGSFSTHPFFQFFYDWGEYPALIISAISVSVLILGVFWKKAGKWRTEALYLFLTFAIGAGLLTNAVFKEYWGRPRPKQTVEFGGEHSFRPFYSPNFSVQEPLKSFPCGHCTTGFFFFSFVFLGRRLHRPWLTWAGWILAFGFGIALSVSRIYQGGHYLSDTIVGALFMWYSALILDWLLFSDS